MKVNEKIKSFRNLKNLTTYQLSKLTDIPQSTISKLENNKRKADITVLDKISKALNLTIEQLMKDDVSSALEVFILEEFPKMQKNEMDEFCTFIKNFMNLSPLQSSLKSYEEMFYEQHLRKEYIKKNPEEKDSITIFFPDEDIKNVPTKKFPSNFISAAEARAYVDMHSIFGSDGFDADKLSDDEIIEFANELMNQMSLIKYKYKK